MGDAGTILTSNDGNIWTCRKSGYDSYIFGVAYGGNAFVAVGAGGTILRSSDGIRWAKQVSGVNVDLKNVVYGNDTFAAVGNDGTIITSSDGVSWAARNTLDGCCLETAAYGGGTFVAIGWSNPDPPEYKFISFTPHDGISWTSQEIGTDFYGVAAAAYGGGSFVAVDNEGVILTSHDGTAWTPQKSGVTEELSGIVYGNGRFVAIASFRAGRGAGIILTSSDGISWDSYKCQKNIVPPRTIAFGGDTFVAVGDAGGIFTSDNGTKWTKHGSGGYNSISGVTYGKDIFVAVSYECIMTSQDGANWAAGIDTGYALESVAYGNGTFATVGRMGTILTSPDEISWNDNSLEANTALFGVCWGGDTFVTVGQSGTILTSPDGITWTRQISGTANGLNSAAYGNGTVVIVGEKNTILQSEQ